MVVASSPARSPPVFIERCHHVSPARSFAVMRRMRAIFMRMERSEYK